MIAFHPLADLFPLLQGDDFEALVADVQANGLRDPIVVLDGAVLDGRNRYRALRELNETGECRGVGWGAYAGEAVLADDLRPSGQPWFETYSTMLHGDPLAFVISKNLQRRHLNDDQRRMVAARLANLGRGRPKENPAECGIKVADAAKMLNTDAAGTERARTVLAQAAPELRLAVDNGKLTVAAAAQALKLGSDVQRRIAEEAQAGAANVVRSTIKQETRAAKELALGEKQTALPKQRFGVIIADPEWRFEPWSRATGMDRAADNHYPTSCTEVIASRDVASIAADDCVLFLWATVPMLPHALLVMAAWGFEYRSNFVWGKDRIGTGYWNRNRHEHLLVGVKGNVPAPAQGSQWDSLINASVRTHSQKPDDFLEMIESYFQTLPKIELNRRGAPRPGWSAWGNEAEASAQGDVA